MSAKLFRLLDEVVLGNCEEAAKHLNPANVNFVDPKEGLSLLNWAVTLGLEPMAHLLLQRGANLCLADRNGFLPIHRAAWLQEPSMVKMLLNFGADANAVNRRVDRTPLCIAAIRGHVEICRLLCRCGVEVDFRDRTGKSAIDLAAEIGNSAVVTFLLTAGADGYQARACADAGSAKARTVKERDGFNEIRALLCQPWKPQSLVSA